METPLDHIAIIPDGNRRWAKKHSLPATAGHIQGAKVLVDVLEEALSQRIPYMTVWGCSISNVTQRGPVEVKMLMKVFKEYFKKLRKSKAIEENKVRVRILGEWKKYFPEDVKTVMEEAIEATKGHGEFFNLTFLMAYDGREEMLDAVKALAKEKAADPHAKIRSETLKKHLWTKDLPPVDLVIRTGGEPHWSAGFMMWDVAEARLHFTPTLWAGFSAKEFKTIVEQYRGVERRHGK